MLHFFTAALFALLVGMLSLNLPRMHDIALLATLLVAFLFAASLLEWVRQLVRPLHEPTAGQAMLTAEQVKADMREWNSHAKEAMRVRAASDPDTAEQHKRAGSPHGTPGVMWGDGRFVPTMKDN